MRSSKQAGRPKRRVVKKTSETTLRARGLLAPPTATDGSAPPTATDGSPLAGTVPPTATDGPALAGTRRLQEKVSGIISQIPVPEMPFPPEGLTLPRGVAALRKDLEAWLERARKDALAPAVGVLASYAWAAGVARLHQSAKWASLVSKFRPADTPRACGSPAKVWQSLVVAQCQHVMKADLGDAHPRYQQVINMWTSQVPDAVAFQKAHVALLMCVVEPEDYLKTVV